MADITSAGPFRTVRRPARLQRNLTFSYSSNALAAFVALFGLAFVGPLGSKGALLFLMAGMALVVSRPGENLAAFRREWMIGLVALWCVMSFGWSDYTSLTMRYGIQLFLTVMISVVIAYRLAPMTFVKIIFVTSSIAGLASLLLGRGRDDGLGYLGIYASKNALADASSLLIIAALAMLVDRRLSTYWRLPAMMMLFLGAKLLVMGQSSGALVSTIGVIMVFGVLILLQRLTPHMRLIAISLTIVLGAAIVVVLSSMSDQLARMFLDVTGKDITLTGRTDLWAVAFGQIAERPLLGVGFQAFWVQGQPLAEQLWANFGIPSREGFHFHNTILSNAVEIGIPATVLQTLIFLGAAWFCIGWAVRQPSAASVFFALFMVKLCMLMWIEVVYFYQFNAGTGIIIAAICYSHRLKAETRRAMVSHVRGPIDAAYRHATGYRNSSSTYQSNKR
jgi:exopolysaccharide production protein ExoQ